MSRHTPGPWYVGAQNDGLFVIDRPPRQSTDDITEGRDVGVVAARILHIGNARLIASAPDLLAAARAALTELREFMPTTAGSTITALETVIARAEGKS